MILGNLPGRGIEDTVLLMAEPNGRISEEFLERREGEHELESEPNFGANVAARAEIRNPSSQWVLVVFGAEGRAR